MYNKVKSTKQSAAKEADTMYQKVFDNRMELISSIQKGINYKLFSYIKNRTPFNDKEWAHFLDISEKTLQRYHLAKKHIFKSIHSEKILELAEVCDAGLEVFEDKESFNQWLHEESVAFEYKKPFELLNSSYGIQLIIEQLGRYAHGIYA